MGFSKWYVPELHEVKRKRLEMGHANFMEFIAGRDGLFGDPASIQYIVELLKKEKTDVLHSKNQIRKL